MKKLIIIIAVLAVFGFGGYFFASPYLAVYTVRNAIEQGDAEKLSDYVDYPLLRESMKAELNKKLTKDDDGLGDKIGSYMASALADGLVDAMVTPKGLKAILASQGGSDDEPVEKKPDKEEKPKEKSDKPKKKALEMGYRDMNTFAVDILTKRGNVSATLLINRVGLFGWKLTAVEFPE